jgi:hypothetical protein
MENSNGAKKKYAVEALLILALVCTLGFTAWYVWHSTRVSDKLYSTAAEELKLPSTVRDPYSVWKTYSNDLAGVTFKYPAGWKSQVNSNNGYNFNFPYADENGTLTSPSGNKLTWVYQSIGGKGDAGCVPKPGDTPFTPGNKCDSKEIISVKQIPSVTVSPDKTFTNLFGQALYITETKVESVTGFFASYPATTPPAKNAVTYQICLDPFTANEGLDPPKVGTSMGLELPCEFWDTGFNVMFPVKSNADFNSPDAQMAIRIMKSFNSYSAHSAADAVTVAQSAFDVALSHARSTTTCWQICKAGPGEIDAMQKYLDTGYYNQLSSNAAASNGDILCAQTWPGDVKATLVSSSNGTAAVAVNNITATVSLSSLRITNISCP